MSNRALPLLLSFKITSIAVVLFGFFSVVVVNVVFQMCQRSW